MIQLYLLILIIIFLLNYFYNEKRELFSTTKIHASNTDEGIRIFWNGRGDEVVVVGVITNYDYYISITNVNNNITSIHEIKPTKTNNIISYEWSNDDGTILSQTLNTPYELTITSIPRNGGATLASNTLRITKRDVDAADDTNINCNYNTVKSDFFNNLKGKKFNIYI